MVRKHNREVFDGVAYATRVNPVRALHRLFLIKLGFYKHRRSVNPREGSIGFWGNDPSALMAPAAEP